MLACALLQLWLRPLSITVKGLMLCCCALCCCYLCWRVVQDSIPRGVIEVRKQSPTQQYAVGPARMLPPV
jgi:hypothetical protein